jgi:hypothetical protein
MKRGEVRAVVIDCIGMLVAFNSTEPAAKSDMAPSATCGGGAALRGRRCMLHQA